MHGEELSRRTLAMHAHRGLQQRQLCGDDGLKRLGASSGLGRRTERRALRRPSPVPRFSAYFTIDNFDFIVFLYVFQIYI